MSAIKIQHWQEINKKAHLLIISLMLLLLFVRPQILSITLLGLIFTNIITAFSGKSIRPILKNRFFRLSAALALIFILGMIGTKDFDRAIFDSVQKLSILLIGFLIYYPLSTDKTSLKIIKQMFVFSGVFALGLCFFIAANKHLKTGSFDPFYYTELSAFMHPGYFSMYLSFAIALIIEELVWFRTGLKKVIYSITGIIFLASGIFFLASKTSYIVLFALVIIYSIREIKSISSARLKRLISLLVLSFLVGIAASLLMKSNRIKYMIDDYKNFEVTNDAELSTAGKRVLIWQSSAAVIQEHFWLGTGIGNDNSALKSEFEKRGYSYLASRNLNAHNQFIQAFIALGISGFIFMFIFMLYPLWVGYKNKDYLLIAFSTIIILNACTECILNRQAGVLFFTVWAVLLSWKYSSNQKWTNEGTKINEL